MVVNNATTGWQCSEEQCSKSNSAANWCSFSSSSTTATPLFTCLHKPSRSFSSSSTTATPLFTCLHKSSHSFSSSSTIVTPLLCVYTHQVIASVLPQLPPPHFSRVYINQVVASVLPQLPPSHFSHVYTHQVVSSVLSQRLTPHFPFGKWGVSRWFAASVLPQTLA